MIDVFAVPPQQRREALQVLFCRQSPEERSRAVDELLAASQRGEFPLEGLLLAVHEGAPAGAMLFVAQPDGTAFVWPPVASPAAAAESRRIDDALLDHLAVRCAESGLRLGQCIVEREAADDRETLGRNEFEHLTDLVFMERDLRIAVPEDPPSALEAVTYTPSIDDDRFSRLIERTYEQTQDCQRLNSSRTGAEALAAHRLAGQFHPSRWKLYCVDGRDVGILLMCGHPERCAWEIVYLGVAPEVRGRGFGRAIALSGLRDAQSAGQRFLTLAVDCENTSARMLYAQLGFVDVDVRAVYVRRFPAADEGIVNRF